MEFMDEFDCDYECRSVGESVAKYQIPDDWCAEFDAWDGIYPIFCIQVGQIRKKPAMMELKLRIVENENEEYAGCVIMPERRTVVFKIDHISELKNALI